MTRTSDALGEFTRLGEEAGDYDPPGIEAYRRLINDQDDEIKRLRGALASIRKMKPSPLAPTTFPGLVHGPQLLFDNCRRIAAEALRRKKKRPDTSGRILADGAAGRSGTDG